jgi:hypothetical protein
VFGPENRLIFDFPTAGVGSNLRFSPESVCVECAKADRGFGHLKKLCPYNTGGIIADPDRDQETIPCDDPMENPASTEEMLQCEASSSQVPGPLFLELGGLSPELERLSRMTLRSASPSRGK